MKFVSFRTGTKTGFGKIVGDRVIECILKDGGGGSLREAISRGLLEGAPCTEMGSHALADIELLPPIPDAGKLIGFAYNYSDHATETHSSARRHPFPFTRFNDGHVGHRAAILRPCISDEFDFEGELAIVMGRRCYQVSEGEAMGFVAGYSCFADNTARDFADHAPTAFAAKNFLRSGAFGPWLTTVDEAPTAEAMELVTRLNGAVMQQACCGDMTFSIAALIAYISQFTPLDAGDVLFTGTPSGVGMTRSPPVWLNPGDVLEVEIEGVGLLRNTIEQGPAPNRANGA